MTPPTTEELSRFKADVARHAREQRDARKGTSPTASKASDASALANGPDRAAMGAKAFRRPTSATMPNPTPADTNSTASTTQQVESIDRTALWAKAIKEAQRLPPLDFEPD